VEHDWDDLELHLLYTEVADAIETLEGDAKAVIFAILRGDWQSIPPEKIDEAIQQLHQKLYPTPEEPEPEPEPKPEWRAFRREYLKNR
jgi:hypothetical protein